MEDIVISESKAGQTLSIIPLGGLGEIGLNMMLLRFGDEIIVIDAGLMFPEEEMLGIDIVIPDITYLRENKEKVLGLFLTHGHEDHIGAIPYILKEMNIPIYGTALTLGLLSAKLKEHNLENEAILTPVKPREIVKLGPFEVEFIRITHSIVDGVGFGITTPVGRIVHTGDFKVDHTPVDGELLDFHRFSYYGDQGTLALLSDSTNSERKGYNLSEREVGLAFDRIFQNTDKRIILATFASNIHRVQQAVNAAVKTGRKVFLSGKSMVSNSQIALELGYLKVLDSTWVRGDELSKIPDNRILIITTGSQGEPMSALFRMAMNDHKQIQIKDGDVVILSSRVIPGNGRAIARVIDHLYRRGAEVIYEEVSDVHVSGHASQEEQKIMLNLVRPKFFIPVHGEYRHLYHHARLAESLNIPKSNILILENGDVAEFTNETGRKTGKVFAGRVFVDGKWVGDVGDLILRDRQHLGTGGIIIVIIGIEKLTGTVVSGPDIVSRGFIFENEANDIYNEMRYVISEMLGELEQELKSEWVVVKSKVQSRLRRYLIKKMERRPMIIPIIIEM
ncbi:MAG: ribonuclease J [Nitrospirota bacterium]